MKILKKIVNCFYRKKIEESGRVRLRILFFKFKYWPNKLIGKLVQKQAFFEEKLSSQSNKLNAKWEEHEKGVIATSPFWDPLWYVQQYGHKFNRYEALDYWYKTGYLNGEMPSPNMMHSNINGEPSTLAFMKAHMGKSIFFSRNANLSPHYTDDSRIAAYQQYKHTRKAKGVIYSCFTNGYENIENKLIYRYIDSDWDYVLFTDDEGLIKKGQVGIWEIRPLQFNALDNTRNSRWHKTHPHVLFPDYEESIFIDGNINILSDYLFRIIREKGTPIVLPRHFKNLCIYQEFDDVASIGLDKPEIIDAEKKYIEAAGMPAVYGMGETNILYRKHSEPEIATICDEWWHMIQTYSKRDQLSFTYILWQHKIKVSDVTFENSRMLKDHFFLFNHAKSR